MQTQTAERRELLQTIDMLPDESVKAMLNFIKSLQPDTINDDDDGFWSRRIDGKTESFTTSLMESLSLLHYVTVTETKKNNLLTGGAANAYM